MLHQIRVLLKIKFDCTTVQLLSIDFRHNTINYILYNWICFVAKRSILNIRNKHKLLQVRHRAT